MTRRVGSLVALFVVSLVFCPALGASPGGSGHPEKDAVLYELTEQAEFTQDGFRVATSALEGKARRGTPLCPDGLQAYATAVFASLGIHVQTMTSCTVVAVGRSSLSLVDFSGQISGDFTVVVNSDETNPTDAAELAVMSGTFAGTVQVTDPDGLIIDILPGSTFTPTAVVPGFPLPPAATFTGKFRLPYTVRQSAGAAYKSDSGKPIPVRPNERALGDATVRVEVTFD